MPKGNRKPIEREMLEETAIRLEKELGAALQVMARAARGEIAASAMAQWLSENYPELQEQLTSPPWTPPSSVPAESE